MEYSTLNLKQASEHVHLDMNELKHFAQRGEIEAFERGGEWHFAHRALDEWAQRNLLAARMKDLKAQHAVMMAEHRRENKLSWKVASFLSSDAMTLNLSAKAKGGIIRDMANLADKSGFVYDPDALYKELVAREEVASTAIGSSIALLHPRFHDPFMFQESFIAYGRSDRMIFFGSPNGEGTRHFFLICSSNHEEHLHILARLAMLAHGTDLTGRLEEASTVEEAISAVFECEKEFE